MHGVLRYYALDAKNVNEVVRRVAEGGVPILKAIPGFVAYTMMDAGQGHLVTYSVYESKTGTEESTKRAAAWVKENIASMLPNPPRVLPRRGEGHAGDPERVHGADWCGRINQSRGDIREGTPELAGAESARGHVGRGQTHGEGKLAAKDGNRRECGAGQLARIATTVSPAIPGPALTSSRRTSDAGRARSAARPGTAPPRVPARASIPRTAASGAGSASAVTEPAPPRRRSFSGWKE
jgi:hypothetical protein